MFDLFMLHSEKEDLFPESWIGFGGGKLSFIVKELTEDILSLHPKDSYFSICKEISYDTGLCVNSVWGYLKNKNYILIPLLNSLINIWRFKLGKEYSDIVKLKKKILLAVESVKVNNSSSLEIKAVKNLSKELAYFSGAHAADGMISLHLTFSHKSENVLIEFKSKIEKCLGQKLINKIYFDKYKGFYNFGISLNPDLNDRLFDYLSSTDFVSSREIRLKRDYRWKLADGYPLAIEGIRNILDNLFGIDLKSRSDKARKMFVLEIKNKVLFRYLHLFLDFPYGKKSRIVDEPPFIKQSSLEYRLAFAKGVFTFDGGVNRGGSVVLQTYSEFLFKSVIEILSENSINFTKSKTKRGSFQIASSGDISRWLLVFEKETEKWKKLKFFINTGDFIKVNNEADFIRRVSLIYPIYGRSKMTIKKLFHISKTLRKFDLDNYVDYLKKECNIAITNWTLLKNLEILEACRVLDRGKKVVYFVRNRGRVRGTKGACVKNVFEFNPDIKKWVLPY